MADYQEKYGEQYAAVISTYLVYRKQTKAEAVGTARPLVVQEVMYYEYMRRKYEKIPAIRPEISSSVAPPEIWWTRYNDFGSPTTPPEDYAPLLDTLQQFSKIHCNDAPRNNWEAVLSPLRLGTQLRFIWALLFIKCTNGVADTVTCQHFKDLIKAHHPVSSTLYNEPMRLAAILKPSIQMGKEPGKSFLSKLLSSSQPTSTFLHPKLQTTRSFLSR